MLTKDSYSVPQVSGLGLILFTFCMLPPVNVIDQKTLNNFLLLCCQHPAVSVKLDESIQLIQLQSCVAYIPG